MRPASAHRCGESREPRPLGQAHFARRCSPIRPFCTWPAARCDRAPWDLERPLVRVTAPLTHRVSSHTYKSRPSSTSCYRTHPPPRDRARTPYVGRCTGRPCREAPRVPRPRTHLRDALDRARRFAHQTGLDAGVDPCGRRDDDPEAFAGVPMAWELASGADADRLCRLPW